MQVKLVTIINKQLKNLSKPWNCPWIFGEKYKASKKKKKKESKLQNNMES